MKLHLPKLLLTAVLAACAVSQTVWADSKAPADSATAAEDDLLWSYVDGTITSNLPEGATQTGSFSEDGTTSSGSFVSLTDINSTSTAGFTVSFDLLSADAANWRNIFALYTNEGSSDVYFQKSDSGDLMIYVDTLGGGTTSGEYSMGALSDLVGQTLTVTFAYDSETNTSALTTYANGKTVNTLTFTYADDATVSTGLSDFLFGSGLNNDRAGNSVRVNNVGVWDSAMTASEVAANILAAYTYAATLTGMTDATVAEWTVDGATADFANLSSRDSLALAGGEGGGTLVLSDALSVKNVSITSGSVTLQGSNGITSTTMSIADSATLTVDADATVGALTTGSASTLNIAEGKTVTAGAITIADSTTAVTLAAGAVLDLSSISLPDSATYEPAMNLVRLINKASGDGTIKLANAANVINSASNKYAMTFDTNYEVGTDSTASLAINSWHSHGSWVTHTVTENGSINIGGGAGTLELLSGQKLSIEGGSVAAGKLSIGHSSTAAAYSGAVVMSSGSLTVGEIFVQNMGATDYMNTISLTGGTLTITGAEAITYDNDAGTAYTDATLGGSGESSLTLKTAGTDWSVSKSATEGSTLTIGNITIDAANANMITINSAALTGDIQNNATAEGAGLTLSGDFSVEGSTTITETEMTENGYSTISTNISIDCFKGNGNYVFSDSLTFNGIAISDYTKSGNTFTYSTGEQTGTIYHVVSADHTVDGSETNAAVDATGYKVYSGRTLTIAANQSDTMTSSNILAGTVGEGNITVSTDATIGNGVSTLATGTLTVNNGATLAVGEGTGNTSSIASFGAVSLDDGTLRMHNNGSTVNNLTVASESTLHVEDSASAATVTRLAGTTMLNAELNVTSSWKGTLQIDKLTGVGNLDIDAANNWGGASDSLAVNINALDNYSGVISYKSAVNLWGTACTNNIINIKNLSDNEYKAINMGGLNLEAGVSGDMVAPVTANVDIGRNGTYGASSLGAVTMSGGSVLNMFNRGGEGLVNMTSLTVADTATIGTTRNKDCYQSTVNIGTLANGATDADATLNLVNGSKTTAVTAYNLNGGDGFNGTINVKGDSDSGGDRRVALNINSANAAKGAVINFLDASTIDTSGATTPDASDITANKIALGLGASATVAGLGAEVVEGQETVLTTNAVEIMGYKIKAGVSNFTTRADDDTDTSARTLTIDTAEGKTYDVNANINSNINLVKSGSGTQNISGNMANFDGTVEVSGGVLGFTNAAEGASTSLTNLTLSGGKLDVTGTLTLTNVTVDLSQYTAGTDFELVKAGGYGEGSNFDWTLSNTDAVGNYTVALEKKDNSVWLTWDEVTSITTTISGVESLLKSDNDTYMLTLNIGEEDSLANVDKVTISGISDDIMKQILGLDGLPKDGMVGITLLDKDGVEFTATADQMIGFQGNDGGVYYGQQVGTAWQYQAAYIPEPTTATLSLLALVGLAARRRRKA